MSLTDEERATLLAEVIAERYAPPVFPALLREAQRLERTAREQMWRQTVSYWERR